MAEQPSIAEAGTKKKKRSCDSKTFVEQHGAKQREEALGSIFQQQGAA